MILPIVAYGSNVLRSSCKEIDSSYPNLDQLIDNMFETMYAASGVGLAHLKLINQLDYLLLIQLHLMMKKILIMLFVKSIYKPKLF